MQESITQTYKSKQTLGILRQNFHLIIILFLESPVDPTRGQLSPVTARAACVKDQACLTSLLIGMSIHAVVEGMLAGGAGIETIRLLAQNPLSSALPVLGASVFVEEPTVDVGTVQPERVSKGSHRC